MTASLPEPPPADPLPTAEAWLAAAAASGRLNYNAMALATALDGRPSVRMVLLKELSVAHGYAVFYTNYRSRKAHELEASSRAAGVLYWADLGRQLRLEGLAVRSPAEESDAYFATRPLGSRLNAWASAQSEPLADRAELEARAAQHARAFAGAAPRPPHWGGYRLWLDRLELWAEGRDRFHERLAYTRELRAAGTEPGPWRWQRLQP